MSPQELWIYTGAVLVGSFLLALTVGLRETAKGEVPMRREPGIDAYIDQMAAANGAHLNRHA